MRRIALVFALVLVALVIASRYAPARLIGTFLSSTPLQLSGYTDSLWQGRAARSQVLTPAGPFQLGALTWELRAWPLLTGTVAMHVTSDWGRQRGEAQLRARGDALEIDALDASFDASLIKQALPIALGGRIELLFPSLVFDGQNLVGADGRALWRKATWMSASGRQALGDYALTVQTSEIGNIELIVETLTGALQVAGEGQLNEGRYDLSLRIESPESPMDPNLQQALSLIATPTENGYLLRLSGDLIVTP
ncbi:MAG: hypothetical protein Cons2KO_24020 [Congregibacter sp.]